MMRMWRPERTQWLGWPFFRLQLLQLPRYACKRASASVNIISVPAYSLMIAHAAGSEVGTLREADGMDEGETVGGFVEVFIEPFWLIYLPNLIRRSS